VTGVLLDTHALLWYRSSPERLDQGVADAVDDPDQAVFYSVASLHEITIKVGLGKLHLATTVSEFAESAETAGLTRLDIRPAHLDALLTLPQTAHRDPFDRLLLAQAKAECLAFASRDGALAVYGVPLLWS
jgi:PIN domain nuclease of toxin-antitoxin system